MSVAELQLEFRQIQQELTEFIRRNERPLAKSMEAESDENEEMDEEETNGKTSGSEKDLNKEYREAMAGLDAFIRSHSMKRDLKQNPLLVADQLQDKLARVIKLAEQTGQRVDPKVVSFVGNLIDNAKRCIAPAAMAKALVFKQNRLAQQLAAGLISFVDYRQRSVLLTNLGPDFGDLDNWLHG